MAKIMSERIEDYEKELKIKARDEFGKLSRDFYEWLSNTICSENKLRM